jgi:CRISPR-associated exonuclease Cas4
MMGDRDFRITIKNAIDSIGRELEIEIDADDLKTINLAEVVQCLRRSYYDRTDSKEIQRRGFNDLLSGLLRKLEYGSEPKEFLIDDIKLKGQADMLVDDNIILFRPSQTTPESPHANDLLYLNACLWIYDKTDGMIIYITNDREEFTFSLTRDKKMFEEVIRRVRVLSDLLNEHKTPILEPSHNCMDCQYYERCFIKKKTSKQLSLSEMLGLSKEN